MRRLALIALCAVLAGCADSPTLGESKPPAAIEQSTRSAAEAAEAGGDFASASGSWGNLVAHHPEDPELAWHLAHSLRRAGQGQAAIDAAQGFIDRHGKSPALLVELGKDYLAADRLGLAVRTLTEATALAPKDWEGFSALGVAEDYQGHYVEARQAYAQALALSPDNPTVLNNLGLSQALAGHLAEARATLEKAADQPHATPQTRQNLALVKALAGDLAGAERLNRQDLTPEQMRANSAYYRMLLGAKRE
jgi:Flp pilus assembly protein TadD